MEIGGTSSQEIRDQFMTLLLAQLRNQDPLSPVEQQEFVGQLAQFSTLEGIEDLNSEFAKMLDLQTQATEQENFLQATTMLGNDVTYAKSEVINGESKTVSRHGRVDKVELAADDIWLTVGTDRFQLEKVSEVRQSPQAVAATEAATGTVSSPQRMVAAVATEESTSPANRLLEELRELLDS